MLLLVTLLACSGDAPRDAVVPSTQAPPPLPSAAEPEAEDDEEDAPPSPSGANRPPIIKTITLSPKEPRAGQNIIARSTGKDPDGDKVDLRWTWTVNDETWLDEVTDTLSGAELKRGDKVQAMLTASDGQLEGKGQSAVLEIGNTPPVLLTTPQQIAKSISSIQIEATDADEDRLSYRLENAPDGMEISYDGRLTYAGSETEKGGTYKVTLVVDDGHTGYAKLQFSLNVSAGQTQRQVKVDRDGNPIPDAPAGSDGT